MQLRRKELPSPSIFSSDLVENLLFSKYTILDQAPSTLQRRRVDDSKGSQLVQQLGRVRGRYLVNYQYYLAATNA